MMKWSKAMAKPQSGLRTGKGVLARRLRMYDVLMYALAFVLCVALCVCRVLWRT